jgi:hypothetical protein
MDIKAPSLSKVINISIRTGSCRPSKSSTTRIITFLLSYQVSFCAFGQAITWKKKGQPSHFSYRGHLLPVPSRHFVSDEQMGRTILHLQSKELEWLGLSFFHEANCIVQIELTIVGTQGQKLAFLLQGLSDSMHLA